MTWTERATLAALAIAFFGWLFHMVRENDA